MSQKALVSTLCAACVLLALSLALVSMIRSASDAHGETGGVESGKFIMATLVSPSGSRPAVYVLNTETELMAAYETSTSGGIELKGIRRITWDLQEHYEWPDVAAARKSSVRSVKDQVDLTAKKRAAAAAAKAKKDAKNKKKPKP